MRRLLFRFLSWFFPSSLAINLPVARKHGTISFTEVQGAGWQCTIRPPSTGPWKRGAINCWSATGDSINDALENAILEAERRPVVEIEAARMAPRLGGAEFDDD